MNYKKEILKLLEEVDDSNKKGMQMIYGFVHSILELQKETKKTRS